MDTLKARPCGRLNWHGLGTSLKNEACLHATAQPHTSQTCCCFSIAVYLTSVNPQFPVDFQQNKNETSTKPHLHPDSRSGVTAFFGRVTLSDFEILHTCYKPNYKYKMVRI